MKPETPECRPARRGKRARTRCGAAEVGSQVRRARARSVLLLALLVVCAISNADVRHTGERDHPSLDRLPGSKLVSDHSQAFTRYEVLESNGIGRSHPTRAFEGRATDLVYRVPSITVSSAAAYRTYRTALVHDGHDLIVDCDAAHGECAFGLLEHWAHLSGRARQWPGIDVRAVERRRTYRLLVAMLDSGALTLVIADDPVAGETLVLASLIETAAGQPPALVGVDPIARGILADGRATMRELKFHVDRGPGPATRTYPATMRLKLDDGHTLVSTTVLGGYLRRHAHRKFLLSGHYASRDDRGPVSTGVHCSAEMLIDAVRARHGVADDQVEIVCLPAAANSVELFADMTSPREWVTDVELIMK